MLFVGLVVADVAVEMERGAACEVGGTLGCCATDGALAERAPIEPTREPASVGLVAAVGAWPPVRMAVRAAEVAVCLGTGGADAGVDDEDEAPEIVLRPASEDDEVEDAAGTAGAEAERAASRFCLASVLAGRALLDEVALLELAEEADRACCDALRVGAGRPSVYVDLAPVDVVVVVVAEGRWSADLAPSIGASVSLLDDKTGRAFASRDAVSELNWRRAVGAAVACNATCAPLAGAPPFARELEVAFRRGGVDVSEPVAEEDEDAAARAPGGEVLKPVVALASCERAVVVPDRPKRLLDALDDALVILVAGDGVREDSDEEEADAVGGVSRSLLTAGARACKPATAGDVQFAGDVLRVVALVVVGAGLAADVPLSRSSVRAGGVSSSLDGAVGVLSASVLICASFSTDVSSS